MAFSTSDFERWSRGNATEKRAASDHAAAAPLTADLTGMPTFARLRLQEHAQNPRAPFTSNLSVGELLLTRSLGYLPVAQVIGASVYRIGSEQTNGRLAAASRELIFLTEARTQAWRLAGGRLEQQASAAAADVVTGVRLAQPRFSTRTKTNSPGYGETIEVSLSGTAMRIHALQARRAPSRPILTTLSGGDLYSLYKAGTLPAGIAYGCCVYYQSARWSVMQGSGGIVAPGTRWLNQEVTEYAQATQAAQRAAVDRMRDQAMIFGADGVIDVRFNLSIAETEREFEQFGTDQKQRIAGLVVTVEAIGTAIQDNVGAPLVHRQAARTVIPLSD